MAAAWPSCRTRPSPGPSGTSPSGSPGRIRSASRTGCWSDARSVFSSSRGCSRSARFRFCGSRRSSAPIRTCICGNRFDRCDPLPDSYTERFPNVQAAIGLAALDRLDEWTADTRRHARAMDEALRDLPGITVPQVPPKRTHVYYQYCVYGPQRDELVVRCVRRGVDIETLHVDVCSDLESVRRSSGRAGRRTRSASCRRRDAGARLFHADRRPGLARGARRERRARQSVGTAASASWCDPTQPLHAYPVVA